MKHRTWTAIGGLLVLAGADDAQVLQRVRAAPPPEPFVSMLRVPEDVPTLQEAIWRSSSGGLILVRGEQEPVVVDRPLSILGDPEFVIDRGQLVLGGPHCAVPGIELVGPGTGVVTVVGLRSGVVGECFVAPAIAGGGFDEVRIYDSDLSSFQTVFAGGVDGTPGIEVDADLVLVSGSFIQGGRGDVDECAGFLTDDGHPAVLAPRSIAIVLDSTLAGGDGGYLCCQSCSCPQTLTGLGGIGGDGVVAQEVFQAASTIVGGIGSTFFIVGPSSPIACGSQPHGAPVVAASHVVLTDALQGATRMALGSSYTLTWTGGPGPVGGFTRSFWAAYGIQAPTPLPGGAWSFLPPSSTVFLGTLPASPASWTFAVPNTLSLLWSPITFQAADENGTVTRPVSAAVTF